MIRARENSRDERARLDAVERLLVRHELEVNVGARDGGLCDRRSDRAVLPASVAGGKLLTAAGRAVGRSLRIVVMRRVVAVSRVRALGERGKQRAGHAAVTNLERPAVCERRRHETYRHECAERDAQEREPDQILPCAA